jgi:MinD-like ATPase involved in chromosome partitioning or flagellar assembly
MRKVVLMTNGKIIAVWGSGNSGKTTTAVKLATKLAGMKKDVLIVLTDIAAPDINVLLPFEKDTSSMGDIWSTPDCNIDDIYNSCVVTEWDNICILGYKTGENVFSYPEYTKENITRTFLFLKGLVDYVIVDCISSFAYNVLSTVALEIANKVIRLGEATPKSFAFFQSNLPLLTDSRYRTTQHIKVLSKTKDFYAKETATNIMGGIDAELPYVEEIEFQMLTGELLTDVKEKSMKSFQLGIDTLIKRIDEEAAIEVKKKEGSGQRMKVSNMKLRKREVS